MERPKVGDKWKVRIGGTVITILRLDPLNNKVYYTFDRSGDRAEYPASWQNVLDQCTKVTNG